MTLKTRILNILLSLVTIACCIFLLKNPDDGYYYVVLAMDVLFLFFGIRKFLYYMTQARYMTGGISVLYKSIIYMDFGIFSFTQHTVPPKYISLYLAVLFLFFGVTDIIDAYGAKKIESDFWMDGFITGMIKILIAMVCLFHLNSIRIMTYVLCAFLIFTAISGIVSAFRRSAIIYIS